MTYFSNTLEGGTNGTTVSAANSGGASGSAFSGSIGSGGSTYTYSTAAACHGSLGLALGWAASGAVYVYWTIAAPSATSRVVGRFNWSSTTTASATQRLLELRTASALAGCLQINTNRTFSLSSSTGAILATSPTGGTADQTYRIEWAATPGASTTSGVWELNVYTGADSSTLFWSTTVSGANLGSAALATVRFGGSGSAAAAFTAYYDDLAVDDSGAYATGQFIGPVINSAPATVNVATTATATSQLNGTTAEATVSVATSATASHYTVSTAPATVNLATSATAVSVVSTTANAGVNVDTSATAKAVFLDEAPATIHVSTDAAATSWVPPGYLNPFSIGVYDKHLAWQQNIGDPVHATFVPRILPAVGTAEIELRSTDPVNEWLQTDGARILVWYRGEFLFSGPVVSYQGDVLPGGTVTYQFEADDRVLAQTLGWVVPTGHLVATSTSDPTQTTPEQASSYQGYYDWGGALTVETAVKQIVKANFDRLGRNVVVNADQGRGGTVAQSNLPQVRFDTLDTVVDKLLQLANVGLTARLYQSPGSTHLNFEVYPSTTWAQALTYESGIINTGTYSVQGPAATRAVVGGPGQDTARAFQGVNDGTGLESGYGQTAEVFVDSTSGANIQWPSGTATDAQQERYYPVTSGVSSAEVAAFVDTLTAAGQNALASGAPTSGIDITLSETAGFHYGGTDGFHVGDTVTVQATGSSFTEQITECSLAWTTDAFSVQPTLGKQTNDPNVVLLQAIQLLATRLRQQGTGR